MSEEHWLINSNRSEVKRFIKNDKSIVRLFEFIFIEFWEIDIAREIYEIIFSQGWEKTKMAW